MISPKHFEELSFPSLQKLIANLKDKGIKVGLHICGNTKPILSLMAKTGADYVEIDQAVDLGEAKEVLKETCMIGNVSTSELLAADKDTVLGMSKECIQDSRKVGYILSSGCEVPYNTPIENIQALVEMAEKFGTS